MQRRDFSRQLAGVGLGLAVAGRAGAQGGPVDVAFRQVPVGFSAVYLVLQKTYYALEELGQLPNVHRKMFAAIHQQNKRLGLGGLL